MRGPLQPPPKGQSVRALAPIRASGYHFMIITSYSGKFLLIIVVLHPEGESNAVVQAKVMIVRAISVHMGTLKL